MASWALQLLSPAFWAVATRRTDDGLILPLGFSADVVLELETRGETCAFWVAVFWRVDCRVVGALVVEFLVKQRGREELTVESSVADVGS